MEVGAFNKSKTVPRSFLASEVSHKSEEDHRSDFNYFRDDISIHDGVFPSCSMPRFNPRNVALKADSNHDRSDSRERERERKFVILEKMNGGKMNFFLRIGTIRWWEFGAIWRRLRVEIVERKLSRRKRKENLYEESWREFEPCARFITPIIERRGGDPSLIYRDARLEKTPTISLRKREDLVFRGNATPTVLHPELEKQSFELETRFDNNRE